VATPYKLIILQCSRRKKHDYRPSDVNCRSRVQARLPLKIRRIRLACANETPVQHDWLIHNSGRIGERSGAYVGLWGLRRYGTPSECPQRRPGLGRVSPHDKGHVGETGNQNSQTHQLFDAALTAQTFQVLAIAGGVYADINEAGAGGL